MEGKINLHELYYVWAVFKQDWHRFGNFFVPIYILEVLVTGHFISHNYQRERPLKQKFILYVLQIFFIMTVTITKDNHSETVYWVCELHISGWEPIVFLWWKIILFTGCHAVVYEGFRCSLARSSCQNHEVLVVVFKIKMFNK